MAIVLYLSIQTLNAETFANLEAVDSSGAGTWDGALPATFTGVLGNLEPWTLAKKPSKPGFLRSPCQSKLVSTSRPGGRHPPRGKSQ